MVTTILVQGPVELLEKLFTLAEKDGSRRGEVAYSALTRLGKPTRWSAELDKFLQRKATSSKSEKLRVAAVLILGAACSAENRVFFEAVFSSDRSVRVRWWAAGTAS